MVLDASAAIPGSVPSAMSVGAFWNSLCADHGGLSHAVMHEAGHAVVAAHLGYQFEDVSVYMDPREHQVDFHRLQGGGVRFSTAADLERITREDPQGSLQICLAGALAERAGFDHCLDQSFEADLNLWRNQADLLGEQTPESIEVAVGASLGDMIVATNRILKARSAELLAVSHALGEKDEMLLTFAQVKAVLDGS